MVYRNVLKKTRSNGFLQTIWSLSQNFWDPDVGFFWMENGLEMSDKGSKCRIREVNPEGLKLTASAMSHFQMASLLEVDRNKRGSLITLCWTMALTVSGTHLTVRCPKRLCSCFSCHLAFTLPYIYLFSLRYWRAYTYLNNVESEAICCGNKCIMVLMFFF